MYFIYFEHKGKRTLVGHAEDKKAASAILNTQATEFIVEKEGKPRADKRWLVKDSAEENGYWIEQQEDLIKLYRKFTEEHEGILYNTYSSQMALEGGWYILEYNMRLTEPFRELCEARDQLVILKKDLIASKKDAFNWREKFQNRAGAKIAQAYDHEPDTPIEDLDEHFKTKIPKTTKQNVRALGAITMQSLIENKKFQEMHRKCELYAVCGE